MSDSFLLGEIDKQSVNAREGNCSEGRVKVEAENGSTCGKHGRERAKKNRTENRRGS
jgi:hypothetical protein